MKTLKNYVTTENLCTDQFGNVVPLLDGETIDEYLNRLITGELLCFYGNGKDIIDVLVMIAKRFQARFGSHGPGIYARAAVGWLYAGNGKYMDDLFRSLSSTIITQNSQRSVSFDKISNELVNLVAPNLPDPPVTFDDLSNQGLSDQGLSDCYLEENGRRLHGVDSINPFYVYRSMPMEEYMSVMEPGPGNAPAKFKYRAGDLLQASTYSGDVLVECSGVARPVFVSFGTRDGDLYKSESIGKVFLPGNAKQYSFLASEVMSPENFKRRYFFGKISGSHGLGLSVK